MILKFRFCFNYKQDELIINLSSVVSQFPKTLLNTLDKFRCTGLYTDMVIRTAHGDVTVHRLVMAAASKTVAMSYQVVHI